MKKNQWGFYFLSLMLSVLFTIVVLVTAIELVTFNKNFYRQQYTALNNHVELKMDREELYRVTWELLDYIRGERSELNTITAEIDGRVQQVFSQREIAHMVDVRKLFAFSYTLRDVSLLSMFLLMLVLYYTSKKKVVPFLPKAYLNVCLALFVLGAMLYVLMQTNFTRTWDWFHYIFFDNDLWLLDPATDRMILMVPEPFFYSAVARVLTAFTLFIAVPAVGSLVVLYNYGKRSRKKKQPIRQ